MSQRYTIDEHSRSSLVSLGIILEIRNDEKQLSRALSIITRYLFPGFGSRFVALSIEGKEEAHALGRGFDDCGPISLAIALRCIHVK